MSFQKCFKLLKVFPQNYSQIPDEMLAKARVEYHYLYNRSGIDQLETDIRLL